MRGESSQKLPVTLFESIENQSVPDAIVWQVEDLILNGILKEGGRLPPERDMADRLRVSRPKLREALDTLRSRELLSAGPGECTVVSRLTKHAMSPALIDLYLRHPKALDDHLEFRRVQESFAARLAAVRATETDRQALTDIVAEMVKAHDHQDDDLETELDLHFHAAVVDASHNRHLIHTMASLYELNRKGLTLNRQNLINRREVAKKLLQQHEAICAAICAGQADEAAAAAEDHIDFVRWSIREAEENRERRINANKRSLARQVFVPASSKKPKLQ
ncbi:MAG TPA: GntR family transcriptional regulator [Gammaproteobacteria bacterium]|jgi:GntR family transcriptional repressor for pyruvate dehydrogenase complex|nr:GntR family transcriptional regulator [Gammaproteobacteria bacterium]